MRADGRRTRRGAGPGSGAGIGAALAIPILALALVPALPRAALGNGGTVRISRAPVGPWFVTVYSSPTPLRTGEIDISVLVQDSSDAVLDVPITVDAAPVGFLAEAVITAATRRQATNKLFKAAKFDIETPGTWQFRVRVGAAATAERPAPGPGADAAGPGGVVSFQGVVAKSTILDRPFLLAALVILPLLVLGWMLLGREPEPVPED